MAIRFAEDILKEMDNRDLSKELDGYVSGEKFEEWLYSFSENEVVEEKNDLKACFQNLSKIQNDNNIFCEDYRGAA